MQGDAPNCLLLFGTGFGFLREVTSWELGLSTAHDSQALCEHFRVTIIFFTSENAWKIYSLLGCLDIYEPHPHW